MKRETNKYAPPMLGAGFWTAVPEDHEHPVSFYLPANIPAPYILRFYIKDAETGKEIHPQEGIKHWAEIRGSNDTIEDAVINSKNEDGEYITYIVTINIARLVTVTGKRNGTYVIMHQEYNSQEEGDEGRAFTRQSGIFRVSDILYPGQL